MFTLAMSCVTTSNLPWFMDLTFQVPMQYYSLQHWTLLPSPVTATMGRCFHLGCVSSFFLELVLHWSPVAFWAPTDLGSSSFSVLSSCLSICSWGSQGKNTEMVCIPFSTRPWFVRNVLSRHPGMWNQVDLRKHYYKHSYWRWWNFSWAISNPKIKCC